jgi:maleate isomerase
MNDYCGWRARIGLIYMASSIVMEPEFYAMAPEGVSIHTTRIRLPSVTVAGLSDMMASDEVERCTADLATAPLHVILFGGTSATFVKGLGWDETVRARMAKTAGRIPVTTTSTAVLKALRALGVQRLSLVTPYIEEVNARGRAFLEENGFTVLSADGLGLIEDHAIGAVPLERVYEFTRTVAHPDAEAVFISCTNLRTVGAIAALEADLGVPVISAIQASFWECLRTAHLKGGQDGFGCLFGL